MDESARLDELRGLDLLDTLPEKAFDDLTALASQIAGTPISLVSLVDEDRQWFKSEHGLGARETPRDEAFCAHAILDHGNVMVVEDTLTDPRFVDNPLVVSDPGIRFYAGAPLVTSRGHALGTLCVIDREPRHLTREQLGALETIARQVVVLVELRRSVTALAAAALVQRRHEAELEHYQEQLEQRVTELAELSLRDGLTGLWNRTALEERLTQDLAAHRRQDRQLAAVMVDIDHFKSVNDNFGHQAGDVALQRVAEALKGAIRDEDVAARYGGEEFTVVLADADLDGALLAAERMRLAIERLELDSGPLTASFGVATASAGRETPSSLLEAADKSLYAAKEAGRNTVRFAPVSTDRADIVVEAALDQPI